MNPMLSKDDISEPIKRNKHPLVEQRAFYQCGCVQIYCLKLYFIHFHSGLKQTRSIVRCIVLYWVHKHRFLIKKYTFLMITLAHV